MPPYSFPPSSCCLGQIADPSLQTLSNTICSYRKLNNDLCCSHKTMNKYHIRDLFLGYLRRLLPLEYADLLVLSQLRCEQIFSADRFLEDWDCKGYTYSLHMNSLLPCMWLYFSMIEGDRFICSEYHFLFIGQIFNVLATEFWILVGGFVIFLRVMKFLSLVFSSIPHFQAEVFRFLHCYYRPFS